MYIILLFMVASYAVLYGNFMGGCLAASLFLVLVISIIYTKIKYQNAKVVFQKESDHIIISDEIRILGELQKEHKARNYELKVRYEMISHFYGTKKKRISHKVMCPEEHPPIIIQKTKEIDLMEINIKDVWIRDVTGSVWISCKGKTKMFFMIQPKRYPLSWMNEKFHDYQRKQWDSFDIREYQSGDKISRIHWKLLASKQSLYIKNISMEDEDGIRILMLPPKDKKMYHSFYTVLYSVCGFFIEHSVSLVVCINEFKYSVKSFDDLHEIISKLYLDGDELNSLDLDFDYKIYEENGQIYIDGDEKRNVIQKDALDEIRDIRL